MLIKTIQNLRKTFFSIALIFTLCSFELMPVIPLTDQDKLCLKKLIASDKLAYESFLEIKSKADEALDDIPNPASIIYYEGLHDKNPLRQETIAKLKDVEKAHYLGYAYVVSGEKEYAIKAKEFILAWASSYKPTGNPINENKLTPFFVVADYIKDALESNERSKIFDWMESIAKAELNGSYPEELGNWRSKRIKIVAMVGSLTNNENLLSFTRSEVEEYIEKNFNSDGSTFDLRERDALSYHSGGLKPLLSIILLLKEDILNLYSYENSVGGSVKKSVELVIPYARGEKIYPQWTNSKVAFDSLRYAEGNDHYKPGTPWDPISGLELFEYAQFFDDRFNKIVQDLSDSENEKYPTWESVLAAAKKPKR